MKKGLDKQNKQFKVTPCLELLFWVALILLFLLITSNCCINNKISKNDYQIFLQDVDGLIEGSPVRMMGVEVGYITRIIPTNDEVFVKFILTNPNVYIPRGTVATVEFSGMAGSKSLELYLPTNDTYIEQGTPLISVNPPKRLHDAFGLLNEMMKKIGKITYSFSSFGVKLEEEGLKPSANISNTDNIEKFIQYSNEFLEDSMYKVNYFRDSLKELNNVGK